MFEEKYGKDTEEISSISKKHLWGIILAGGEGNRLQHFIKEQYGYNRPKQYCTVTGTRSLIRHTLDRALKLILPNQLLTVVNNKHAEYVAEEIGDQPLNTIIIQPCARETSAGILLPMLKIYHRDPASTVTVFPSDHFINEENLFMDYVMEANRFVEDYPDMIVLLGVQPNRIESGYGWIEQGDSILYSGNKTIHHVRRFWEKPDLEKADTLWHNGSLWNTFVMVGKTRTFIKYIEACVPEVFNAFKTIRSELGGSIEKITIENLFRYIPEKNFSRFVLEQIPEHLCVMEVSDVYWSDWGEEHRIINDIEKFNLRLIDSIVPEPIDSVVTESLVLQ
jgi:mannose-1-phosphate guanylyltransferase